MCILSVAECDKDGKSGREPGPSPGSIERPQRIQGWPEYRAIDRDEREREKPRKTPQEAQRATRWETGTPGKLGVSWFNVPGISGPVDRRRNARYDRLILTPADRETVRWMQDTAIGCGNTYVALRGFESGDLGDVETRLVCRTHCGTRACRDCARRIRAHECGRVAGPWKLFLTLTRDRSTSTRKAWKGIHKAVAKWHRELRRELKISRRTLPEPGERRWLQRRERIQLAQRRIRGEGKLEYAWCLESHQDGFPHIHECLSLDWLDYNWARRLWRECVQAERVHVHGRTVWNEDGVCRYLSKYISKGELRIDILALIKGRRAWASTMRKPLRESEPLFIEQDIETDNLKREIDDPSSWARENGWTLSHAKRGEYAKWTRQTRPYQTPREVDGREAYGMTQEGAAADLLIKAGFEAQSTYWIHLMDQETNL